MRHADGLGPAGVNSVAIFLQARMSSTRLPGKVLMPLAGEPALARQIERVLRSNCPQLVLLTSEEPSDDPLEQLASDLGVACFRGSLPDVLGRYAGALERYPCEHIVRLTGDCPLADWTVIDRVVAHHLHGGFDYSTNTLVRRDPQGLDVEVVKADCLRAAAMQSQDPYEREHVMPHFYRQPERFRLGSVESPVDRSALRWTLDYPQDYQFIAAVYERLYPLNPAFSTAEVLALLDQEPSLGQINAGL